MFEAQALHHAAAGVGVATGGSFVPNDIRLGGQAPGFIMLTGPNMGGKSTLLRQVHLSPVLLYTVFIAVYCLHHLMSAMQSSAMLWLDGQLVHLNFTCMLCTVSTNGRACNA